MGLLSRLFGVKRSQCESCGERTATATVSTLGPALRVCGSCLPEARVVFGNPLTAYKFGELVDTARASSRQVFAVPWGSSQQVVVEALATTPKARFLPSQSHALQSCNISLAGCEAKVTFAFDQNGLHDVTVSPLKAVFDALAPLRQRFGEPKMTYPVLGSSNTIWTVDGLKVDLECTRFGTVCVSFSVRL